MNITTTLDILISKKGLNVFDREGASVPNE